MQRVRGQSVAQCPAASPWFVGSRGFRQGRSANVGNPPHLCVLFCCCVWWRYERASVRRSPREPYPSKSTTSIKSINRGLGFMHLMASKGLFFESLRKFSELV